MVRVNEIDKKDLQTFVDFLNAVIQLANDIDASGKYGAMWDAIRGLIERDIIDPQDVSFDSLYDLSNTAEKIFKDIKFSINSDQFEEEGWTAYDIS